MTGHFKFLFKDKYEEDNLIGKFLPRIVVFLLLPIRMDVDWNQSYVHPFFFFTPLILYAFLSTTPLWEIKYLRHKRRFIERKKKIFVFLKSKGKNILFPPAYWKKFSKKLSLLYPYYHLPTRKNLFLRQNMVSKLLHLFGRLDFLWSSPCCSEDLSVSSEFFFPFSSLSRRARVLFCWRNWKRRSSLLFSLAANRIILYKYCTKIIFSRDLLLVTEWKNIVFCSICCSTSFFFWWIGKITIQTDVEWLRFFVE